MSEVNGVALVVALLLFPLLVIYITIGADVGNNMRHVSAVSYRVSVIHKTSLLIDGEGDEAGLHDGGVGRVLTALQRDGMFGLQIFDAEREQGYARGQLCLFALG